MAEDNPNRDQVAGRTDKAAGEIKETVGQATDDLTLEREGASEKAAGEAQQDRGDRTSEVVDKATKEITANAADDIENMREAAGLEKK